MASAQAAFKPACANDSQHQTGKTQLKKPQVVIISPALANANNGNWQTARRWASYLRSDCDVACVKQWQPDDTAPTDPDLMIALHARRSAASIEAYAHCFPHRPHRPVSRHSFRRQRTAFARPGKPNRGATGGGTG
jgi:hypothetical protein